MAIGQSDTELIQKTRSGNTEGFGELVRRFQGRIYTLCLRMTGDPGVAEVLTEGVFLSTYTDAVLLEAPIENWLLQRALAHCETPPDPSASDIEMEPDTETEEDIQAQQLQSALDQMTPNFRAAVILRDVLELDYDKVADIMNLPLGTARSLVHRARLDMADALTKTARSSEGDK